MEEQKRNLSRKLREAETIYDVLVILYAFVDNENAPGNIQNYYEQGNLQDWSEINQLLDELLYCEISFSFFLEKLCSLMQNDYDSFIPIHILKMFDQIFKEKDQYPYLEFGRKIEVNYLHEIGPLNHNQKEYCLYLSGNSGLIKESKAIKKSNCRFMKRKDGSDIFAEISGYRIVRVIPDRKPLIKIKEYKSEIFDKKEEKELRVAIVPLSKEKWFNINYQENPFGKNYFFITDTKQKEEDINKCYMELLDRAISQKAEIVIFPELAMNSSTETEIQKYLQRKSLQTNDYTLKLIFLGSVWKNESNTCVLISGKGTVLCRNEKKNPFSTMREGKEYFEKLSKRPMKYELLDIKDLGRILYVVCKDGLDDIDQVSFWNEYEVNFEVISSLSPSISYFDRQMSDMVEKYMGIAFVSNSCCERVQEVGDKKIIGFIKAPYMRKRKPFRVQGLNSDYYMDNDCMKKCTFCTCMHIFDIKPDALNKNKIWSGMQIDYTRIC